MEIIQERLEREFGIDLITTAPSVVYRVTKTDGSVEMIDNPSELSRPAVSRKGGGALCLATIIVPDDSSAP